MGANGGCVLCVEGSFRLVQVWTNQEDCEWNRQLRRLREAKPVLPSMKEGRCMAH